MLVSDRLKWLGEFLIAFAIMLMCVIVLYRVFNPASLSTLHACVTAISMFCVGGWLWLMADVHQRIR